MFRRITKMYPSLRRERSDRQVKKWILNSVAWICQDIWQKFSVIFISISLTKEYIFCVLHKAMHLSFFIHNSKFNMAGYCAQAELFTQLVGPSEPLSVSVLLSVGKKKAFQQITRNFCNHQYSPAIKLNGLERTYANFKTSANLARLVKACIDFLYFVLSDFTFSRFSRSVVIIFQITTSSSIMSSQVGYTPTDHWTVSVPGHADS